MSNRLTTWELKAVDNLPDLIGRMQQIVNLMQQQAALSATNSAAIQGQLFNLSSSYSNLQKQMQGVNTVQQQQVVVTNQQTAATRQMQQQYESLRSSATSLTAIMAGVFSVAKTKEFLLEVIDANTRVNLFSKSLEAMLKNKTLADQVSAYALDMAQRSPLKVEQIMEVTQRLVAMGAEGSKITTYLEMLGEISSVVGTQKLPLIAKALLDVQNKQKLYAQEVRQFTDNGVPLFQLLADSMDLPIQKVKKLADEHKITFAQVEKALLDSTKQGGIYYGSMGRNAEELAGKLSNLSDVVFLAQARFGEFIKIGLGNAITAVATFVNSITSTDAAMERVISAVKAVTAAVVTYTIATKVGAAATIAKELAMRAYTLILGASQIAMQRLLGSMGAYITINTAATAATRGLFAALAANPIGLIISAVGIATTAYYTWKATTAEMTREQEELNKKISEGTAPMELSRIGFMNLAKEVLNGKLNAEQKYNAFEKLKKQYPVLLKETNDLATAEKWLKLNGIEVNAELEYRKNKFDELKEKYPLQMKGIKDLADAEKKLSPLMKEVNNDFLIRIKLLENEVRAQINNEAAIASVREKVKLEAELATASTKRAEIYGTAGKMEVYSDAEVLKSRIAKLNKTIQESQKFNQNIATQSERLTKDINDDWTAKTAAGAAGSADAFAKGENAKKAKAILTAKEIAVLTKQIQADSLKDQIDLITARMNLEVEQVNHSKKTRQETENAIKQIVAKAEADKKAIVEKYSIDREKLLRENLAVAKETFGDEVASSSAMLEAKKFDDKEAAKSKKESNKEIRLDNKKTKEEEEELQKQISAIHKMEADVIQYNLKAEKEARKDGIKIAVDYISAQEGAIGTLGKVFRKTFEDIDLINGKTIQGYKQNRDAAKLNFDEISKMHKAGSDIFEKAKEEYKQSEKEYTDAQIAANKAKLGLIFAIAEIAEAIKTSLFSASAAATRLVTDAMLKIRDTMKDLYNDLLEMNQTALDSELENFKGSYDERIKLVENFYAKQKRLAEARDTIDASLTFNARMLEINADTTSKISTAWDMSKGPLGPQTLLKVLTAWKNHNAQLKAAAFEREAYEQQLAINRLEFEKEKARQILEAKLSALKEELNAFEKANNEKIDAAEKAADAAILIEENALKLLKDNYGKQVDAAKDAYDAQLDALKEKQETEDKVYEKELAAVKKLYSDQIDALKERQSAEEKALRATYDLKQSLLEQGTSDEIAAIAILDRTRNEALYRYKSDEQARLIATRDRILATLTNENEKRQIIEEFDKKIKDVHNEVEDAKLDKTKGVSLATRQLNAEQKEDTVKLKEEEKTQLEALDNRYQAQFKALANERDITLQAMSDANEIREQAQKDALKRIEEAHDENLKSLKKIQEAREEESAKTIEKIQANLTSEIQNLKNQIEAKDKSTNEAMKAANADYANSVNAANRAIFEATKQMKIAELMAEIAILRGKRNLFNKGKIDSAIDDLTDAIGSIRGLSFDAPNVSPSSPPATPPAGGEGAGAEPTPGAPAPGPNEPKTEQFFQGTPYIEGIGYPNGRDTVPAMVNKGERVMQTHLNELIGGRDVSNEELTAKALFADKVLGRVADIRGMMKRDSFLAPLPAFMIQGNAGSSDLDALANQIVSAINKPSVNINVSPRGMSVRERGQQMQNETYYNNTQYKRNW